MTRSEHLAWCKQRALDYVERGDLTGAYASMTSDLRKHPDTVPAATPAMMVLGLAALASAEDMRRFIEGFN